MLSEGDRSVALSLYVLSEEDWSVSYRRLKCVFVFVLCRRNKAEVWPCAVRIRLKLCLVPSE